MSVLTDISNAFLAVAADVAALFRRDVATLQTLLDSTTTAYAVGDVVSIRDTGYTYEVVAAGGDYVTNGGVRLLAILNGGPGDVPAMGIDATGATDVTLALKNYLIRRAGLPAYIPDGTYKLSGTGVFAPPEGVDVTCGPNVVFDMTDAPVSSSGFIIAGSVGTFYDITVGNANTGAKTIRTGASFAQSLSVGDWLKVVSNNQIDPGRTNSKHGEITSVLGLANASTGYIDISIGLHADYVSTPKVAVLTPTKCKWRGGHFVGAVAEQNNQRAIKVIAAPDFLVEGVSTERMDDRGLWIEDCPGGTVRKCDFRDARPASTGYGVSTIDATQDILVFDCTFRDVRHGFSTNNQSTSFGIPRRITVSHCRSFGGAKARGGSMAWGNALDTHAAAEDIRFLFNTVQGCPGEIAINLECRSGEAIGNLVEDCAGSGINAVNQTIILGSVAIRGNTVRRCGNGGIKVYPGSTGSQSAFARTIVSGNEISGCLGAISLQIGNTLVFMSGVSCTDNVVDGAATDMHLVYIQNCRAPLISGNKFKGAAAAKYVLAIDGCPYSNISSNSVTAAPDALSPPIRAISSDNIVVSGNNVNPFSGSMTMQGITVGSECVYPVVVGNNTRGTGGISAVGTGAVVANNL